MHHRRMSELTEHAKRNRESWNCTADDWVASGERAWAEDAPSWGIWSVPESELRALPDVLGLDVLELGCGTAYWSAWLARRGARVVGLDLSERQLETARRLRDEHRIPVALIHGTAESVPLADASFDLVISEYGASIWCDPYLWIPETARLLRPGGRLVFLVNATLLILCSPNTEVQVEAEERLLRPYFGMHRFEWAGESSVEFHLGYGDWIRLFRANGLEVEDLVEI